MKIELEYTEDSKREWTKEEIKAFTTERLASEIVELFESLDEEKQHLVLIFVRSMAGKDAQTGLNKKN